MQTNLPKTNCTKQTSYEDLWCSVIYCATDLLVYCNSWLTVIVCMKILLSSLYYKDLFHVLWCRAKGAEMYFSWLGVTSGTLLMQVQFPSDAREFFPPRANFQCRFSYGVHTVPPTPPSTHPHPVQSHALTSLCTLKIPSAGSHTIVWTYQKTTHAKSTFTDGIWFPRW